MVPTDPIPMRHPDVDDVGYAVDDTQAEYLAELGWERVPADELADPTEEPPATTDLPPIDPHFDEE